MKILLLNPPFMGKYSRCSRSPAITKSGTLYYPLWLSYATGVLEKEGFEVKLVDAPANSYSKADAIKIAKNFNPDLTVVDSTTPSIYNDVNIAASIKEKINTFVILVGTHPSALPEETLKLSNKIDAVAIREYDYTLKDLAYALQNNENLKNVDGIAYRKGRRIIRTKERKFIGNLDELPFVSKVYKKHLNPYNYFYASAKYPMVMIFSGRGCPYRCFFCLYPQTFFGRKYRLRSAENFVDEIEYIYKNFPMVKEIGIEDDTFTADINRVHKICELMIERKLNKRGWWANVRVNLDYDTMKLMKKAGCRLIVPGFETGSQETLNAIHKGTRVEQGRGLVKNAVKVGLQIHGCFIFGLPGDTKESVQKTIDFAKSLDLDSAQFFPLIPYPGTEAYEWAKKNNYLITNDFSKWLTPKGEHNAVISTPQLSNKEIVELCDEARRQFYLRKGYIFKQFIKAIKDPYEAKRIIKAFMTFRKKLFRKTS